MPAKTIASACCLILCLFGFWGTAHAGSPRSAAETFYWSLGWETEKKHSPAFEEAFELFLEDQKQGYAAFMQAAWAGDPDALAMLCVAAKVAEPGYYGINAEYWEKWITEIMGEGEGTCFIAMHHLLFLLKGAGNNEQVRRSVYACSELFRRSALARNPKGMFGAGLTYDKREPVTPLPPMPAGATSYDAKALRFKSREFYGERQYWLVAASVAGDAYAAEDIAAGYLFTPELEPDEQQAEYYLNLSALRGNTSAAQTLATSYIKTFDKKFYNAMVYIVLAAMLKENKLETADEKNFPNGRLVHIWGQRFLHGLDGYPKSLTQAQYEAAIEKGKALYRQAAPIRDAYRLVDEIIYKAASARLPEVKADFEKNFIKQ